MAETKKGDLSAFMAKAAAAKTVAAPAGNARVKTQVRVRANTLPDVVVVYGMEGVGKTRFALSAPNPVLLATEDGSRGAAVARLEIPDECGGHAPRTVDEIFSCLNDLADDPQGFETLVIDSLDWMTSMIHAAVCARNGWSSIAAPGWDIGAKAALEESRQVIPILDRLRAKGVGIVATAHAELRPVPNPSGPDYSAWGPALPKYEGALWRQYCDTMAFACYEDTFVRPDKERRAKGTSAGLRIMHTCHQPSWQAKNRWRVPDGIPLSWTAYTHARALGMKFEQLLARVQDEEWRRQMQEYVDADPSNITTAITQMETTPQ